MEDMDELGHHCHSDMSSDADDDPFYEYNKCHKPTKLEQKDAAKRVLQEMLEKDRIKDTREATEAKAYLLGL